MATLSRFEFIQPQFDLLCSDLNELPIARASAASAALPLALSPITLKNYAGQCGYQPPQWLVEASRSARSAPRQRAKELLSYLDVDKRPHIHLLDGGLSDNMALRGVLEGAGVAGGFEQIFKAAGVKNIKKLVFISVNAETTPDVREYRSDKLPVMSRVFSSLIDIPINRYSADTLLIMRIALEKWLSDLRARVASEDSVFAPNADIYFIDVSLGRVLEPLMI